MTFVCTTDPLGHSIRSVIEAQRLSDRLWAEYNAKQEEKFSGHNVVIHRTAMYVDHMIATVIADLEAHHPFAYPKPTPATPVTEITTKRAATGRRGKG